jgi:hypothetical protein
MFKFKLVKTKIILSLNPRIQVRVDKKARFGSTTALAVTCLTDRTARTGRMRRAKARTASLTSSSARSASSVFPHSMVSGFSLAFSSCKTYTIYSFSGETRVGDTYVFIPLPVPCPDRAFPKKFIPILICVLRRSRGLPYFTKKYMKFFLNFPFFKTF